MHGVAGFAEGLTGEVHVIRFPEPVGKHHPPRLGIEGQQPAIEQRVDVRAQQHPIADMVGGRAAIG